MNFWYDDSRDPHSRWDPDSLLQKLVNMFQKEMLNKRTKFVFNVCAAAQGKLVTGGFLQLLWYLVDFFFAATGSNNNSRVVQLSVIFNTNK